MNIAIDYDDTYTEDPQMWISIIKLMQYRGHKVYCVTYRYDYECNNICPILYETVDGFFATGRIAKEDFMRDVGIYIDVWIDDTPQIIFN